MTIIYWGPVDSGKHHLREYAKANLKTWTKWEQFSATKYSYTDIMTREIFTNEDDTYVSTHEIIPWEGTRHTDCYINYKDFTTCDNSQMLEMRKNKSLFTDIKRCLPTDLLLPLYANNGNVYKMQNYGKDQLSNSIEYIKTCRNIMPYKENILTKATMLLNKFMQFNKNNPYGNDVVSAYKNDKALVWQFLDDYCFNVWYFMEQWLRDNNIEYEYFNLDKDSYKQTFGWDNTMINFERKWYRRNSWDMDEVRSNTMARELTVPMPHFETEEHWQQYHELERISKEYIKYTNKSDTRL